MARVAEKRRGRDAERTRQDILAAAQKVFSEHGYAEAGVREITAIAGVNPALVSRYFGSKLKLYEAALENALDVQLITDLEKQSFGEQIVARFAAPTGDRVNPLPIMIFGSSDSEARQIALSLLHDRIVVPLRDWFGTADGELRATRFMIFATGFFTYRNMLPLPSLQNELDGQSRAWLEADFQRIVDD